jgi:hypothetical protein
MLLAEWVVEQAGLGLQPQYLNFIRIVQPETVQRLTWTSFDFNISIDNGIKCLFPFKERRFLLDEYCEMRRQIFEISFVINAHHQTADFVGPASKPNGTNITKTGGLTHSVVSAN